MIEDGISFTSYILPNDHGRRSLSVVGINDPDNKGEVRISFGDFFAAKTEELGRLGEDNGNKPRVILGYIFLSLRHCWMFTY